MEEIQYPIRILHVVATMNRAGTETLLMNLYRNIDRSKVQFDFAVNSPGKCDYEDEINSLGGKVIRYPRYKGLNHFEYKKWWEQFFSSHKEYKIIHGHIGSTASIYLKIAKNKGLFTIAHSHNYGESLSAKKILYKIYSYNTRNIADCFFGCSEEAIRERYGRKVARDKTKSSVLNNAIDAKSFSYNPEIRDAVRNDLKITEDTLVIGTVGRLTAQKNPEGILEIIESYKAENDNFLFLWVGRGEQEQFIKNEIEARDLGSNIRMLGVRDDVNEIMQAMDIFIFPSLWEGLGIVAIEAQAAGLPTLCSDRLPNEVAITELCKMIPPDNINRWVNEIISANYRDRKNMLKAIRSANYDIGAIAEKLQDFYLMHY